MLAVLPHSISYLVLSRMFALTVMVSVAAPAQCVRPVRQPADGLQLREPHTDLFHRLQRIPAVLDASQGLSNIMIIK